MITIGYAVSASDYDQLTAAGEDYVNMKPV